MVSFSVRYLAGDRNERTPAVRLPTVLAAVLLVIAANDLVLLAIAWGAASIALHGLLTYFGARRAAVAAAHKKFLLARCADACMVGAVIAFRAGAGASLAPALSSARTIGVSPRFRAKIRGVSDEPRKTARNPVSASMVSHPNP